MDAIDYRPVAVYLPAGEDLFDVLPGSALVGGPDGELLVLDLEGNKYGSDGLRRYADRLHHAWGRHESRYPTVARRTVEPDRVVRIGSYDPREGELTLDDEQAAARLCAWLGVEALGEDELLSSGARYSERRTLRSHLADPAQRERARWYIRHQGREHEDLLSA